MTNEELLDSLTLDPRISAISEDIRRVSAHKGFGTPDLIDFQNGREGGTDRVLAKLALVHSEVSEALEAARKADFENFLEELADAAIRIFDLAHGVAGDGAALEKAVVQKVIRNSQRAHRHGGKLA